MTTIFAPSTGLPPAAIAIVRISGPAAFAAARTLAGTLPPSREARVRALRDPNTGDLLDRAMVLTFRGPATATGEDLVELHLHGGRAVVAAVESALANLPDVRRAEAGEFTRRALANGRIDLAEAEGLGDLLTAETELQRRAAIRQADGTLSRQIAAWRDRLVQLAAQVEAALDFADEADVPQLLIDRVRGDAAEIAREIAATLSAPTVERLRDGIHVVIAGPPNSGKSTLLNALVRREAAIVSPIAGTTRDRIEVAIARQGIPFVMTDTAGLRADTDDIIEKTGIDRAKTAIATADAVLWLGDSEPPDTSMLWVHARSDLPDRQVRPAGAVAAVSAMDATTIENLWRVIVDRCRTLLPVVNEIALNHRQAQHCRRALEALNIGDVTDELVLAEALRAAHNALGAVTGHVGVEAMLDALFRNFCIGK
ncbi:MAG: tRNA uridine-5-carboxymethylaminomethyl(34) synthesis GTPase MnmE [Sphingomonas sp.]|uniref:tRNA uridine-5-carboxymethylaminomethyl(34) synthesis GTPase MnmE n=1 Tax=Sphingomonas sp. TaxID=28214 RepID=UPI001AC2ADEB|nr:tRNA uridine-5-carboxymethylaminomethyl(34) synthesis GTPase MnmE [Sphingomonas sp.]MBN8809045.1 tRNA uridine-5-carboxymethylaminomethyl(34) synthesis GTPase MnmE [Sphingomonas sp.]